MNIVLVGGGGGMNVRNTNGGNVHITVVGDGNSDQQLKQATLYLVSCAHHIHFKPSLVPGPPVSINTVKWPKIPLIHSGAVLEYLF